MPTPPERPNKNSSLIAAAAVILAVGIGLWQLFVDLLHSQPQAQSAASSVVQEHAASHAVPERRELPGMTLDVATVEPSAVSVSVSVAQSATPWREAILDPDADDLDSFPSAAQTWSDVLAGHAPDRGFAAFYLDDGDLGYISSSPKEHPYFAGSALSHGSERQTASIAALASLWQKEPHRLIAQENVAEMGVHYAWDEFHGIPAEDFAACWLGKLRVEKSGRSRFHMQQSRSAARVLLDRHVIYEGSAPETPNIWLEAGEYALEVEYVNNWHTADFSIALKPSFKENP